MKKKSIIFITIILVVVAALFGTYYFVFEKEDTNSTLTLSEKTWIENNKNKIIDIGVVNEIAILNYSGEGLFFNFLEDIEENTGLEFNKISYPAYEKIEDDYAFKRVKKASKDDILVYSDNYVLIGKESVKFNNLNELNNEEIGVLEEDLNNVSKYLNNNELKFQALESADALLNSLASEENELNYVVMPKLIFLSNIENRQGLYINYNITEMKDNYVISLGEDKTLNNIIEKYILQNPYSKCIALILPQVHCLS